MSMAVMTTSTVPSPIPAPLRTLVQIVARSFYEPQHTVVLDQLVEHPVLRDDDLAARLGVKLKELAKLTAVLCSHRLISEYKQNELKQGHQRASIRSYYYIDYKLFINVVKWRMMKIRALLDAGARKVIETKGFACPECKNTYTLLQADELLCHASHTLRCLICRHEVEHNETRTFDDSEDHDRMGRFNAQTAAVVDALKLADAVPIPAFDVASAIRHKTQPVAAAAPPKAQVDVVFGEDEDDEAIRLAHQAQAAATREMNVLPSWHVSSTVALPRIEGRQAEPASVAASTSSLPNSNTLNILGSSIAQHHAPPPAETIAVSNKPAATVAFPKPAGITAVPKPTKTTTSVENDAEFYDRYYASLQNGLQENIPPPQGQVSVNVGTGVKRPREHAHDRDDRAANAKTARSDACAPGQSIVSRHTTETSEPDVTVLVAGQPVPFSQITEEHHERMTPEEYLAYFEVLDARGVCN